MRDNEQLRGLLNAGHRCGGTVHRCVGESHAVHSFQVFAPAVLCGIGSLPGMLQDRSLVIRLERAQPGELRERFDSRRTEREQGLSRKLARWCRDNRERLESCDPEMPPSAVNRVADNWRPLCAVAEIAGGDWPQRIREAFATLQGQSDDGEQDSRILLLGDIREVFAKTGESRMASAEICCKLSDLEEKPWRDYGRRGEIISVHQLATLLRPFRVQPRNLKLGAKLVKKGYDLEDFQDAFDRYLPPERDSVRVFLTTIYECFRGRRESSRPARRGAGFQPAGSRGTRAPWFARQDATRNLAFVTASDGPSLTRRRLFKAHEENSLAEAAGLAVLRLRHRNP